MNSLSDTAGKETSQIWKWEDYQFIVSGFVVSLLLDRSYNMFYLGLQITLQQTSLWFS